MKKSKHQFSILLPETSIYHTTLLVNCLSEQKNVDIHVISNHEFPELRKSKKITNFTYYPKTDNEIDWLNNIEKELEKHSIDLVIPIDVYGIKTLIKHRNKVSFSDKIGILPTLESFDIADNKSVLTNHMLKYDIPFPKTYYYTKEELLQNRIEQYPVLIKLVEDSGGGDGIVKFNNFDQLKTYLSNNELDFNFIIQKYISGYDIDCSVLCEKGDILAYTIQKGVLPGDREFEPNYGVEFLYDEKLYVIVKKLLKTLNWSGVAHIDLRYDQENDLHKVIEINPRFWVSLDASLAAGINFPYLYMLRSLKIDFTKQVYNHIKYYDLEGLSKSIKRNKLFIFKFMFIAKYTPIRFYIKDPMPILYTIRNKIKSLF